MSILDLGNNPISVMLAYPDGSGAIAVPVISFDVKDSHLSSDGLSKTTGTVTISASPLIPFAEALDPLENPARFARKCRVIATIKNGAGVAIAHPRGRLRILKIPASPIGMAPVLEIEIGCLLALKDLRKPPVDDSGIALGTVTTRSEIINRLAAKIGIGALIDSIEEWPINYPVTAQQSYVATMGRLAWDVGYVLWIDNLEQLRARKAPTAPTTPDLRVTIGRGEVYCAAIAPDETPVELVRASGVGLEVKATTNPLPVYAIASDSEFSVSGIRTTNFLGFGTSTIATLTNDRQPRGRVFPALFPGRSSLIYAAEEDSYTYYDEAEGLLRLIKTTIRQPRGIIFPTESPGDTELIDSKEILTRYTYLDDVTIEINIKTYEPAQLVLGTAPIYMGSKVRTYGMKLSAWDSQSWSRQGTGWVQSSNTRRYKPGETSRAGTTYSGVGNNTPPASERRDEPNYGEEKQFSGVVKFLPMSGSVLGEDDRDFEVGHPISDAHCEEHARLEGVLLHGRQSRLNWVLPLRDRILSEYRPLMIIDWETPSGVVTRHLTDGLSFTHDATKGVLGGDSINLGQVRRRSPAPVIPVADGVNDAAEYTFVPYAQSINLIGRVKARGSLFAYTPGATLNLSGRTKVRGLLSEPLNLSGRIQQRGQLSEDEMFFAPLTIAPEGMVLTWVSGTQIQITAGRCVYQVASDVRRAVAIAASPITKSINAAWVAGGSGGRMGSLAANTWYHVFAIVSPTGIVDYMFDISVTGANAPAGYLSRRRIGAVLTDGSSLIRGFSQRGNIFRWNPGLAFDFGAIVPTNSVNLQALTVPLGIAVQPILTLQNQGAVGVTIVMGTPGLPYFLVNDWVSDFNRSVIFGPIYTNTARQVGYFANGTITAYITTEGWIDPLM